MPKRSLASGPSTPSKKRPKVASNQSSLDNFFGTPGRKSPKSPTKGKQREEQISQSEINASSLDDEAYAWKIAERDGLNLETLRRLEGIVSETASTESLPRKPIEVIDVDLLEGSSSDPAGSGSSSKSIRPAARVVSPRKHARLLKDMLKDSASSATPNQSAFGGLDTSPTPQLLFESLAVDPVSYSINANIWPSGSPVPYSFLAHTLTTLSATRSRIAILNILTNSLRTIIHQHPASLLPALYLLSNSLSPPYSPIELGLGPSTITKAIQHVSGLTPAALKRLYNATGDPGDVAFEAKSNVRTLIPHPPLLITGVYDALLKIARAKGQRAANQKQNLVEKLLVAAKGEETRYLVRTLCQNLRVGAVRTSLLTALARAMVLTEPTGGAAEPSQRSDFCVSADDMARIIPLPQNAKKKPADPARDVLNTAFANAEALLRKIYVKHPNYDRIVDALLEAGLEGLDSRLPLTVGVPLLPTLGSPTRSLDEIYDRLGLLSFAAEFKYDGQRAQIHASVNDRALVSVKIFSRHLEDMTDKYPDVVSLVEDVFKLSPRMNSFIVDTEIVAINPADGAIRSFQELSNRARKDVKLDEVKVSVCVFAFDIMYLDGQVLLERPFRERRNLLRTHLPPVIPEAKGAARFDHVRSCESEDGREAIEEFWQTAVNTSCEGLMIKLLDNGDVLEELNQKEKTRRKALPATYEPDKRTSAWLKLKKDYVTGLGDSLDLVPIGAWHGNGRKAQWWSPILLAVWDADASRLVAVCKCMSGFSDAFYKSLKDRYPENSETCAAQPVWEPACETGGLKPEVYFRPQEVWEIRGADVTLSPVSVAALGLANKTRGLSLRFPRFMKVREDKNIEDASTPQFLADMYRTQQALGKTETGVDDGELVDVDLSSEHGEEESEYEN